MRTLAGALAAMTLAVTLAACATEPPPPATLADEAFAPMLKEAFASNEVAEWEPLARALLDRTDLTTTQRADIYFARRIKRGVWVKSGTVATPQCAVEDIDRALALVPTGPKAEAAKQDRVYQESRYRFFQPPGNCD